MKKALLLSVVASSMIMAGGDIAPVEPAVAAPAEVSAWEFSGTGVLYYQTMDAGDYSLFDQESSAADAGIQLRAVNSDVVAGIGAGVEVSGLATLGLENWMVDGVMQVADLSDPAGRGGWISQSYLTYGFGNTSVKVGRQELPKALSPFAFSEDWNVFKNTFDAALIVNTDLPDTTLVGAFVLANNFNMMPGIMNVFDKNDLNGKDGVWMLTAQNKSIENLTLTGSVYYASEYLTADDLTILWGDAQYDASNFNVGLQGGTVMHDALSDDITAFGAKVGTAFNGVNVMGAYSTVNDGYVEAGTFGAVAGMFQIGGTTSALYTDLVGDQLMNLPYVGLSRYDMDKFIVKGDMDALGGNISAAYGYTDYDSFDGDLNEFDLAYTTNIAEGLDLSLAYVYLNVDVNEGEFDVDGDAHVVRVVGTYNF